MSPHQHAAVRTLIDLQGWAMRRLPDGRVMSVQPLMFGRGRVCLGPNEHDVDDNW